MMQKQWAVKTLLVRDGAINDLPPLVSVGGHS